MFTRSTLFIPLAIVLAPIFILVFLRSQQPGKGILFTLLGFCLNITIALWGLYGVLIFDLIRNLVLAILLALPYIADRLMYSRFKGFLSTLVFPVSATVLYYLFSLEGPFDGDSVFGLYFIGDLPLKQLVSVTGLLGLVFVLSWVSSVISWVWGNEFQWNTIKKGIALFSSIIILVFVFGGVKLSPFMSSDDVNTVRIAAITVNSPDNKFFGLHYLKIMEEKTSSP